MPGPYEKLEAVLRDQHALIRRKGQDVLSHSQTERRALFNDFRRFVAAHEAAEQQHLHQLAGRYAGPVAAQEEQIAQLIAELEKLQIDSAEFEDGLRRLHEALTTHDSFEETTELPGLRSLDLPPEPVTSAVAALRFVPSMSSGDGRTVSMEDERYAAMLVQFRDRMVDPIGTAQPTPREAD